MKRFLIKTLIFAMAVATCLSFTACSLFHIPRGNNQNLPDSSVAAENVVFNTDVSGRTLMNKVDAIAKVERSVVAIRMQTSSSVSFGSGVIVDMSVLDSSNNLSKESTEFYILTCHHVVSMKGNITVYVPDKEGDNFGESDYDENGQYVFSGVIGGTNRNYSVILIGGDATSDIAVLKLTVDDSSVANNIVKSPIAPVNPSVYSLKKGEDVFAIGNPSGTLPGTVSVGTISYINRETNISDVGNMTLLQINVDIYHGSSGGGLFNYYGELIGITNAGSDENSGLNYAIPYVINPLNGRADNGFVNVAQHLAGTFTANNYGYISGRMKKFGFTVQQENATTDGGQVSVVTVTLIESGSKAEAAGMHTGDIISTISVNGGTAKSVSTIDDLTSVMQSLKKGDTVKIVVERVYYRGYETKTLSDMTAEQLIFCDTGIYN